MKTTSQPLAGPARPQSQPLKNTGDRLDPAFDSSGSSSELPSEDDRDPSSVEKLVLHGRHMGF